MITKRRFLASAVAAGTALALTLPASAQDRPFEGEELSVLMEGHPTTDAIQKLVPEFTEATGIDVSIEVVPESDITSKMLLELSSGSGRYDLVQNNIIYIPGFVENGYIVPLDDYLGKYPDHFDRDDFVPGYFDTNLVDDKIYGLPVYGESTFVMYRKDLFEEYGLEPPSTFEAIESAAKTIHDKGDGDIVGITLRGAQGIQSVYVWAAFLWGYGGSFLDEQGNSALATPEGVAALEEYATLLRDYGPVGVANFGWEENRLLFQQGKAAMTLDATVNGAYTEDESVSSVVGKVGYLPVPTKEGVEPKGGASSLAVHSLFVTADSKIPEAAALFAAWMTSKDAQIKSIESEPNSGVSSLSAIDSEAFNSRFGAFKEAMLDSIDAGNPQYLPTITQANEVINNTGIAVSKALAGTASAEEALKEADAANQKAIER